MKPIFNLSILLLLFWPMVAMAELPQPMKDDFSPLTGYVIMPVGGEYLVDLDASDNLHTGDILALVTEGEKIIHPVTKEVLGSLDTVRGYLQVTRIKAGYSYAKLLTADISPGKGEQVKRFEQVPALFVSGSVNEPLRSEIKTGLPQLTWLDDQGDSNPLLVFSLVGNMLTVRDASGATLKTYHLRAIGELASEGSLVGAPISAPPTVPANVLLNQSTSTFVGSVNPSEHDESPEKSGIIQSKKPQAGVWMGPNLKENPVGMVVGDFDNDGKQETAIALENHLLITQIVRGEMVQEADVEFAKGTGLLSIDAIDMDGNGQLELYLSAVSGSELSSQVVEYRDNAYRNTVSKVPFFLRVAELSGGERTLLGQPLGSVDAPFGERIFRVSRSGDELLLGQNVALPAKINLFSFYPAGFADQEQLFAYVTPGEYLKVISAQGDEFWGSDEHFGGSDVRFYPEHNKDRELVDPILIQQRLLKSSTGEILAVQNEGLRTFKRYREFKKSRIVAFKWSGFAMQESWKTSDQNGYLADFALADADNDGDDELVMVVKYQQKSLFNKGRSSIVIYELAE